MSIVAVSDHVSQRFFVSFLFLVSTLFFGLLSQPRVVDASGTLVLNSPMQFSSSNFGSLNGSGSDLDGLGTRSGGTTDEKLDALLSKCVHFENEDRSNSCSHAMDVSHGITHLENTWGFCDSTYRDGTEFQCSHRTSVQSRDTCCFSIICIRLGKILAFT